MVVEARFKRQIDSMSNSDTQQQTQSGKFPLKGYLFLVGTALFTAFSYAFGRAVDTDIDAFVTTFYWFAGAFVLSIFTVLLIPSQKAELRNLRKYTRIFIYSSLVTSLGAALWIMSLRTIGLPLTSFLMKAQTLFSLTLGIMFLGERLNRGETIGIIITIAGGIVVAYQRESYLIYGTLTALGAAFCYSFLSFIIKKTGQDLNMLTVATLRTLGVSIALLIYIVIMGKFHVPSPLNIIYMALGGITGAYVAKACQFQSIKLLDVSRSTAVMPMESLFVILLSFTLFGELPSFIKLMGGVAIITGVVFLVIFRGQKNDILGK